MEIFGGTELLPQEVILEANPLLIGDVLSIHLSQVTPNSAAVWKLRVFVRTFQGEFLLGSFTTNAPSALEPPARVVGFGSCPGAVGWKVLATCPTNGEVADLIIASSKCCASTFGVTKNATFA